LRRLFLAHLGASPQSIAQTRRAHFARKLLDETDLPMTEVAAGSGFTSVRRFNDAMRRAFHQTPRELRAASRNARGRGRAGIREPGLSPAAMRDARGRDAGWLELRLPYRPPLDWPGLMRFLAMRAIPGVEMVDGDTYRRTVALDDGRAAILEVRPAED